MLQDNAFRNTSTTRCEHNIDSIYWLDFGPDLGFPWQLINKGFVDCQKLQTRIWPGSGVLYGSKDQLRIGLLEYLFVAGSWMHWV